MSQLQLCLHPGADAAPVYHVSPDAGLYRRPAAGPAHLPAQADRGGGSRLQSSPHHHASVQLHHDRRQRSGHQREQLHHGRVVVHGSTGSLWARRRLCKPNRNRPVRNPAGDVHLLAAVRAPWRQLRSIPASPELVFVPFRNLQLSN
uniref:(northern house mosquito) hypothetical protein n=1 Tax=Culex pipiens TaxID=7175 RepID=A0A8D8J8Z7_CULPI